ncbi:MAG: hypothetical protein ABF742_02875 [Acetobacter orientalis]
MKKEGILSKVWKEPYLETCCRSALHRLCLSGDLGRPEGLQDDPCLKRMQGMGFVARSAQGRFYITEEGQARHTQEVLKRKAPLKPGVGS